MSWQRLRVDLFSMLSVIEMSCVETPSQVWAISRIKAVHFAATSNLGALIAQ